MCKVALLDIVYVWRTEQVKVEAMQWNSVRTKGREGFGQLEKTA